MAVTIKRKMLTKPFKASAVIGGIGFLASVAGFNKSFEAGIAGAVIAVAGLTGAAITSKLYEELFDESIYGNLFSLDNLIEVEE